MADRADQQTHHIDRDDAPAIDESSIATRLAVAVKAIDQVLGPGTARAHPQLIAACIVWQVVNDLANAISKSRTGD